MRFNETANQRWEGAGRAFDAGRCRGNEEVTVDGTVPVVQKLPPFRQGINLLIDPGYFLWRALITRNVGVPVQLIGEEDA